MTNNKLTDNKIIKALECCAKSSWLNDCDDCPCFDPKEDIQTSECQERLMKYALDLINRLQAENEALINGQETLQKHMAKIQVENERLTHITRNLIGEIKAEAYKEFAEKLKEKSFQSFGNYGITRDVVEVCDIDNLVKEFERKESTTYDD